MGLSGGGGGPVIRTVNSAILICLLFVRCLSRFVQPNGGSNVQERKGRLLVLEAVRAIDHLSILSSLVACF